MRLYSLNSMFLFHYSFVWLLFFHSIFFLFIVVLFRVDVDVALFRLLFFSCVVFSSFAVSFHFGFCVIRTNKIRAIKCWLPHVLSLTHPRGLQASHSSLLVLMTLRQAKRKKKYNETGNIASLIYLSRVAIFRRLPLLHRQLFPSE